MPLDPETLNELKELGKWARSGKFVMDHIGQEMENGDTTLSFILTVSNDGRSAIVGLRDGREVVIQVDGDSLIAYPEPSIEGTVIRCILENGDIRYYDTLTGTEMNTEDEELRKRNPHFYQ